MTDRTSPNLTTHRARGSIRRVAEALGQYRRVLVTAHIRPDGDAVGSCVAMARMLKAQGWAPTVALSPLGMGPPRFLLDYADCVAPTNIRARDYDCALVLDCGGLERLPEGPLRDAVAKLPILNIDHHVTTKTFGHARWVVPDASSTGELVHRFAKRLRWPIDTRTAEALWVALVTDTGRFAYSCTHPSTLRAAAELLAHGVDSSAINDRLYLYASEGAVLLKRKAYDSLTTWFRGRVALISLTSPAPSPPPKSPSSSTRPRTNPASPVSASAPAATVWVSPPPPSPSTSAAAATSAPPAATSTPPRRPPSRPSKPISPPSSTPDPGLWRVLRRPRRGHFRNDTIRPTPKAIPRDDAMGVRTGVCRGEEGGRGVFSSWGDGGKMKP